MNMKFRNSVFAKELFLEMNVNIGKGRLVSLVVLA